MKELKEIVESVVKALADEEGEFSAHDVTTEVRTYVNTCNELCNLPAALPCCDYKYEVNHDEVKKIVLDMYRQDMLTRRFNGTYFVYARDVYHTGDDSSGDVVKQNTYCNGIVWPRMDKDVEELFNLDARSANQRDKIWLCYNCLTNDDASLIEELTKDYLSRVGGPRTMKHVLGGPFRWGLQFSLYEVYVALKLSNKFKWIVDDPSSVVRCVVGLEQ